MKEDLELNVDEAWKKATDSWNSPRVPYVIAARKKEDLKKVGEMAGILAKEYAFMKFPEFQTYANLARIEESFGEDGQRGLNAILEHEIGHRFCPYDLVTMIILQHDINKALEGIKLPYSAKNAAPIIMNQFTDMCINTRQSREGNSDIPWAYATVSKKGKWSDSKLFRVYGRSMEHAWQEKLFEDGVKLSQHEEDAAKKLAELFEGEYFHRYSWRKNIREYAKIIAEFLESQNQDGKYSLDNVAGNAGHARDKGIIDRMKEYFEKKPGIDDKTAGELAKRIAEIGQDGMPSNKNAMKDFQDIMAGLGQGNPKKASVAFYDMLSDSYDVMFAERPFGSQRNNPFQPVKWQPSMDIDKLDIDYSVQTGGRIIPGVNTYAWNTRKREKKFGVEQVVPNLDLFLDSSGSMPDPTKGISLAVLAGFVVSKKAHRKNAKVRAVNFSGEGQHSTAESSNNLSNVFENLVTHYGGGTVLPVDRILDKNDPKQVVVVTDTYLGNYEEAAKGIEELMARDRRNHVTIYATINQRGDRGLRQAGAEIIYGTSTDIFKKVIGKAHEVYDER